MKKVYYRVKFRNWGADSPSVEWCRTKAEADDFYSSTSHCDSPKAIVASTPEEIEKIERYFRPL